MNNMSQTKLFSVTDGTTLQVYRYPLSTFHISENPTSIYSPFVKARFCLLHQLSRRILIFSYIVYDFQGDKCLQIERFGVEKVLFTLKMLIESPDELRKWLTSHLEPL